MTRPLRRIKFSLLFFFFIFQLIAEGLDKTQQPRDFYKILGVPKNAKTQDIKKRYRELSKKYHPDQNPDAPPDVFLNIRDAHEVLTNPEQRQLYDEHGEKGLDPNFHPGFPNGFPGGFPGGGKMFFTQGGQQFFFTGGGDPFEFFQGGGFEFPGGGRQRRQQHPDLYPAGGDVLKLTGNNWDAEVYHREFVMLINFYNPGCSPCVKFKTAYESVAKYFKDEIPIAAVSCLSSEHLCDRMDVQSLPTLLLLGPDKEAPPIKYKGEKTEIDLKKWLNQNVPLGATVLTLSNFDSWIVADSNLPKVVFFTETPVVPMLCRSVFHSFEGRMSAGIVYLGTSAGKDLRAKKFTNWDATSSKQPLPFLLHITDIDALTGELVPMQAPSKTVLPLIFSRIVAQKRAGYAGEKEAFRELTARRYLRGDCGPSDGQVCILLLVPGSLPATSTLYKAGLDIVTKFAKDPVKVFWVDAKKQSTFAASLGFSPELEGCDISMIERLSGSQDQCEAAPNRTCFEVVALRPKKLKFKALFDQAKPGCTPSVSDRIERFVDSVVNGGAVLNRKIKNPLSFV